MAESLVSHVLSQLTNLLIQEAASLGGVRQQIEWVETQLHLLQGFLKDADFRRKRGDAGMESWITGMRGVAYEMEDIVDTIMYMAERRRQRRGCMGSISRYSLKPCELITLRKIRSRIEQIKIQIQTICQSTVNYALVNPGQASAGDESWHSLRESSPHSDDDDSDVIGFEDDKKELMIQLLDANEKTRCVISIVGMGGLGKTTLARKVYNDPAIKDHFEAFAWVSVSQSYRGIKLLKDIIKKVMGSTAEDREQMDEEELREKLRNFLRDKKYLVVMDDVWTVDVWREMRQVFPDENKGSRILLTTREVDVANRARSSFPPYKLHTLNDTESLELLCRKAFPPKQDVPTDLKELAQTLAKRCGGLPLALVALGGLLSGKDPSYDAWWSVAQSMNWKASGDGKECLNILGLSYNDLPYPLKPCFLSIAAAFPEDSIIFASKLVRLWVAEGFIPQEPTRTMEETARVWLDNLVQRCMIQVVERNMAHGWVQSIRIHDMLRDFGQSEGKSDGFLDVCSSDMAVPNQISCHRAAFHNRMQDEVAVSLPHLRTLLGFNLILKDGTAAGRFLHGLKFLRVLDLEDAVELKELPKEIGSMIHLRYLGLRSTGLKRLPSSIRHLLNLQTLDVRYTDILWLPKSFWKIQTLRHVFINSLMFLSAPISGDHKNLQTLDIRDFPFGTDFMYMVRSLGARLIKNWVTAPGFTKEAIEKACERMYAESLGKALKKMNSLVSLTLDLGNHKIPGDALFTQAPNLHQLRSLNLDGVLLQLPDSRQFPPNLTKIKLSYSKLEQDPMPVLEKLPNLRFLELGRDAYIGKSISCSAGGFPRLQRLELNILHLEEWRVEVGAMPTLTHLTINYCLNLKMLPEGLQHVTTLRELKLIYMCREFNDRVRNEDGYHQHIPSIIFENTLP